MVKLSDHDGVDDSGYSKKINSQPCHLESFILSNSKTLMSDVIFALHNFENTKIYYSDTDSIYTHKNDYEVLKTQGFIGKELFQSKNDSGDARIIYGLFLAPKIKYCLVINEIGVISQKTTFKGYDNNISRVGFKDLLDLERGKMVRNLSKLNWERELYGVEQPHRSVDCENCQDHEKSADLLLLN